MLVYHKINRDSLQFVNVNSLKKYYKVYSMVMHGLKSKKSKIQSILDRNEWKSHPLYTNYYIAREEDLIYNKNTENIFKGSVDFLGYIKVSIQYDGKRFFQGFHRLKWEAYHEKTIPYKYEIDHIDNNCRNNSLDNLELLSKSLHGKKTRSNNENINKVTVF